MTDQKTDLTPEHFNQPKRRKAEFMQVPNTLKKKVGSGGLNTDILKKAQALLENNIVDFKPMGEVLIDQMSQAVTAARQTLNDSEKTISDILFPVIQLKQSGGMFHYKLVTDISDRLVQFLEVIEKLDKPALEVIEAFNTTLRAIVIGEIKGDGGSTGRELYQALVQACMRYFEKFPDNKAAD